MKNWLIGIGVALAIIFGVVGFVFGGIAIHEKRVVRMYDEPPSFEKVEEELEFWLVSDNVHVERKEKIEDYIVYYVQDYSRGFKYYAVVYKIEKESAMKMYWKYSHHVSIDGSEFRGEK